MLDLSNMSENYAKFNEMSLSELEQALLQNVEQIREILAEY